MPKKKPPPEGKEQEAVQEESAAAPLDDQQELAACTPVPVNRDRFNARASIPYKLTTDHLYLAMSEFVNFLGFINQQLNSKTIRRFESMLMPANFSSMVGEFMAATIPKHCLTLVKNQYHNGHPDLLPKGKFPGDAVQHAPVGIELKASRYARGWQGHNPEECWLMVFVFDSNRPTDAAKGIAPRPFRFRKVFLGELTKQDWLFSGRSETSRRTITASVTKSGFEKMKANWLYDDDATAADESKES
jgi:hypothetical protein